MERVLIVGSGASGVHFALSVLKKGYEVSMLDVGQPRPEIVRPDDNFNGLKTHLDDPVDYFLGRNFESVVYPDSQEEYYGFPPNKTYLFSRPEGFYFEGRGFDPLFSFGRGGLAEAWTGGVYPFNEQELSDFPFPYREITPFYEEVAERIGISGAIDDLARFMPAQGNLLDPLDLDEHSAQLLTDYQRHKDFLNRELGCFFGRSRVAALSREMDGRPKCSYLGRCLWGCPSGAFYTPSITLEQCKQFSNFHYRPGLHVSHFKFDGKGRVTSVVARSTGDSGAQEFPVERLVLAAGALGSSKIFLESIYQGTGEAIRLPGLMDNRQVFIPFVNLKMVGRNYNPDSYQYHQVALGFEGEKPEEYMHGLITTLKTALIHPILKGLPLDLKSALFVFRNLRASLGLVNLNFHDYRREENYVALETSRPGQDSKLIMQYSPAAGEKRRLKDAVKKVNRALRRLGCVVPPGMTRVRPMGASVHYAGTLPMSKEKRAYTTSEHCQSHDFENLYIVDGATFPFLPAKNITFTLMANAARVAERVF